MKKVMSIVAILISISGSVNAQDAKAKVKVNPSEKQEISASNHLKKSLQQKQLSSTPERLTDPATASPQQKQVKKKKRRCGTKPLSKV